MSKVSTQEEVKAVPSTGNTHSLYDVDVNKVDGRTFKTKLHLAANGGDYDWCKGLVDSGDIVKYLHQAGAEINITNNDDNSALMLADKKFQEDIVKYSKKQEQSSQS